MSKTSSPVLDDALREALATTVLPEEVFEAGSAWLTEALDAEVLGTYLVGRDGSYHLDETAPSTPRAPARLNLRSGGTEPGQSALVFDYNERPLGATLVCTESVSEEVSSAFAKAFAPALFRALYLDDTVRENARTRQQLFYLDEMGKLIGQLDLDLLLVNILELTTAHLGADIGSITVLHNDEIETKVDWGLPHSAITELTLVDGTPALRRAIDSRQPLLLERGDLATDADTAYNFDHLLIVPMVTKDAVWGTINLVAPTQVESLTSPALAGIRSGVGLAATAVENALLFEIKLAREREQEQLKVGHQIQNGLLPSKPPEVTGLDLAGSSVSATMIGGDYYDYFELPDGRVGLAVADVAGKGVPAGLIMTATRALFRAASLRHSDPPEILEEVNQLLCAEGFGSRFVTAIVAAIDLQSGDVVYSTAGHDAPLVHRAADGRMEDHPLPALPLGLRPDARYAELKITLAAGDTMVLYTDGVTEAMDVERQQFSNQRLRTVLADLPAESTADTIRDAIVAAVDKHCMGRPRHDDTTLIVARRT